MRIHRSAAAALAAAALAGGACKATVQPAGPPIFVVEVSGETFRIEVTDDARVAGFEARLLAGQEGVISGRLVAGDGGFNEPWSWHLDPGDVHTADLAIEVCDGRPGMVEQDLQYWIETVGRFCPWGAKVVERER